MRDSESSQLVVCSIMVSPARKIIWYKFRSWVDQVVKIIVHTFVVDGAKIPLDQYEPDGYWYCAGEFCNIDEPGASQHISGANIEFAKCLVAPNIKDDHKERPKKVISGEYGVHYVCHNITNRVLYASDDNETLVDLDIPISGYEFVVKSALGIYGQNKHEWLTRCENCSSKIAVNNPSLLAIKQNANISIKSRKSEIAKIHLRASHGDQAKAKRLTGALNHIDSDYLDKTQNYIDSYDNNQIDLDSFNIKMVKATNELFSKTISEVGFQLAKKIYPGCKLETEEIVNEPQVSIEAVPNKKKKMILM